VVCRRRRSRRAAANRSIRHVGLSTERKRLIQPIEDMEVTYAGALRLAVKISSIGLGN
jgi:hypothetical protein